MKDSKMGESILCWGEGGIMLAIVATA